jgi:hypothetical protein
MRQFWSIDPANEQRLCWNLNALLQKIGDGNRGEITISWMVKAVTAIARRPPRICGEVLQFCSDGATRALPTRRQPLAHHEIATSARRARPLAGSHGREEDRPLP